MTSNEFVAARLLLSVTTGTCPLRRWVRTGSSLLEEDWPPKIWLRADSMQVELRAPSHPSSGGLDSTNKLGKRKQELAELLVLPN